MPGFLSLVGRKVLLNGYRIIPIKPGEKFPVIKGWLDTQATPELVARWLRNGHAEAGVGIITGDVSFVDLDTPDLAAAEYMRDWVEVNIGFAPIRIGNAPKHGLMYRSPNPFRKIASKTYVDDSGKDTRVEVLGIGQQFVAFAIHPETHRPYQWGAESPEVTPVAELPPITEAQARAACEAYDEYAASRGWKIKQQLPAVQTGPRTTIVDDEFGLGTDPIGLDDDELSAKVMAIPNNDLPYEDGELTWLHMMMAIWHETGGSAAGKDIAYSWSDQSYKHDDARFEKSWNSFGKEDSRRRPITARYILKWAKVFTVAAIKESVNDIILRMDVAGDLDELRTIAADAKKIDVDVIDRSRMMAALRKNATRFNANLTVKDARDMLRFEAMETPDWLKGWVYVSHADKFLNTDSKIMLSERAFNNTFMQYTGELLPSDVALKYVKIHTAYMIGYLPGATEFFDLNGREFANTYSERNVPKVPAKLEGRDRENVQRVLRHLESMVPDKRERELWISWHAYIVQTRKRPNWAIVLQGTEGDGKNFFGDMMAAVLGGDNCKTVFAKTLEAPHNAWAEGSLFAFVEEIRMVGHNRHDVLNSMKPLITNPTVEIHAKNINPYNILNTQAYMLSTNFQNALPVGDSDRRYFVLMSEFQSAESVEQLPSDYFTNLFNTLTESPGAIRGWLLAYKLHPEFDPQGRAPRSHGKDTMIELNKSDELVMVEDLIESEFYPEISRELIVVSKLADVLSDKYAPYRVKETQVAAILRQLGFTYLGRPKIDGRKLGVRSKNSKRFLRGTVPSTVQIGRYLKNPL